MTNVSDDAKKAQDSLAFLRKDYWRRLLYPAVPDHVLEHLEWTMNEYAVGWYRYDWTDEERVEKICRHVAVDMIYDSRPQTMHGTTNTRAEMAEYLTQFLKFLVQMKFSMRNVVVGYLTPDMVKGESFHAWSEWDREGMHTMGGHVFGVPATGKHITGKGLAVKIIRNRELIEERNYWDGSDHVRQLGALVYDFKRYGEDGLYQPPKAAAAPTTPWLEIALPGARTVRVSPDFQPAQLMAILERIERLAERPRIPQLSLDYWEARCPKGTDVNKVKALRDVVAPYFEAVQRTEWTAHQRVEHMLSTCSDAFVLDATPQNMVKPVAGRTQARQALHALLQVFPDIHVDIFNTVVGIDTPDMKAGEDFTVWTEWRWGGTQRSEAYGVAPTHRYLRGHCCGCMVVSGGKIVEHRVYWDAADHLRQLGVLAYPWPRWADPSPVPDFATWKKLQQGHAQPTHVPAPPPLPTAQPVATSATMPRLVLASTSVPRTDEGRAVETIPSHDPAQAHDRGSVSQRSVPPWQRLMSLTSDNVDVAQLQQSLLDAVSLGDPDQLRRALDRLSDDATKKFQQGQGVAFTFADDELVSVSQALLEMACASASAETTVVLGAPTLRELRATISIDALLTTPAQRYFVGDAEGQGAGLHQLCSACVSTYDALDGYFFLLVSDPQVHKGIVARRSSNERGFTGTFTQNAKLVRELVAMVVDGCPHDDKPPFVPFTASPSAPSPMDDERLSRLEQENQRLKQLLGEYILGQREADDALSRLDRK